MAQVPEDYPMDVDVDDQSTHDDDTPQGHSRRTVIQSTSSQPGPASQSLLDNPDVIAVDETDEEDVGSSASERSIELVRDSDSDDVIEVDGGEEEGEHDEDDEDETDVEDDDDDEQGSVDRRDEPDAGDREEETQPSDNPAGNAEGVQDTERQATTPTSAPAAMPGVQVISPLRNSPAEFKTTSPRRAAAKVESDDDSDCCSICFESWTNSGNHRLASLKCGHLFGQSCIEKWLKGQGGKCPQCNAKAKKGDIRVIYAKTVKMVDTTERDRAMRELEKEKQLRRKVELEAAQTRLQYELALQECNRIRVQLDRERQRSTQASVSGPSSSQASCSQASTSQQRRRYQFDSSVPLKGESRLLGYDAQHGTLVVSQPSPNQLFPGFGVKKVSAMDLRSVQYVSVHSKAIRDICFSGRVDGLMLTASIDKTLKITSLMSNTVVQTYHTPFPVWACCWNREDNNYVYAGLQNGSVLVFDQRDTSKHVEELAPPRARCPIVAMSYVPRDPSSSLRCGGLLLGTLQGGCFWEKTSTEYRPHPLPMEGSCTSLRFEPSTRHCLASFRPDKNHNSTRHLLCELESRLVGEDGRNHCSCHVMQTFYGGSTQKLLTRSALFASPEDPGQLLVCAGDEASTSAQIWSASTAALLQKIPTDSPVLDVCPFSINDKHQLGVLTDKLLRIYSWT
ncbi:PREDICTED: E3 ubiquitin-protein ligase RFWD3-like isoform X1 [Branchiostoma belcheri]|uniref:RING-type E3 ubiquitin transferase n=1 Tax=Branchiostoma belcheri TaxID=7741 RepID=A0A6P4YMV8_BRABE|nr:PREDICTED: E3 ubiquitin-protein ligase RFWD3-like isoform X1 [Branchiostoma belcheri]XP_019630806.1 PREDICTED: E3 ubiquitin-protein ligase RFWD3-like isoform X1 [Branchiostoma belcheri]XP_019630807.1 PREDICTED: E3 ubiquitin-protein ligase RFWD3-like isoform X1 [Branchiostoma belcheri]XP_019630808.1 PREDICTED: E3 ubiquitin-protein ligase RFWD3-like isoform X1 [Branchiostoma belcheri]